MLKVLYLPIGKQPGMEKVFRYYGVNLRVFDFLLEETKSKTYANNSLISIASDFNPDLIHMQLQMTDVITNETLITIRKKVPNVVITNWTGDIRKDVCREFINKSKVIDYSLLSNVGQVEAYRKAGCRNPQYWQIGIDPDMSFPKNKTSFKYDVSFIANAYPANTFPDAKFRFLVAEMLVSKFGNRCGLFGSGYPAKMRAKQVAFSETNNIYNDSLCVVSVSNFNDVMHYFSDRLLMCIASGRPTISYRFPGIESYFADGSDLLVAHSLKQIEDYVNYLKSNIDIANNIGKNGALKVLNEHTFYSRVLELLHITGLVHKL